MELNQFRDVDVVLDKANDNIIQKQFVSAGDKDGRSLTVQITENGVIGEIIGATLNLYWHNQASGLTDLSAFSVADRATSVFKIDYPQNMLTPGKVVAHIQILHGGKVTHTKPFEITVQNLAGTTRGVLATAEYSALVTTLAKANEFETEIAEVSAQLAQTANKDEIDNKLNLKRNVGVKIGEGDITQSLKESMTGGSVAVVGKNSVEDVNVTFRGIGAEKTNFMNVGKNLFDVDDVRVGTYINQTGEIISNTDYSTTAKFIYVDSSKGFVNLSVTSSIAFYDADYTFISRYAETVGSVPIPSNALWVKLAVFTGSRNSLQLEYGKVKTPHEKQELYINKLKLKEGNFSKKEIPLLSLKDLVSGKNIFDVTKASVGTVDMNNGVINTSIHDGFYSSYTEVEPNTHYTKSDNANFAFYTENRVYIPNTYDFKLSDTTFISPPNARYIVIAMKITNADSFQLEKGATKSEYEPFGYRIKGLLYDYHLQELNKKLDGMNQGTYKSVKYPNPGIITPEITLPGGSAKSLGDIDNSNNIWAIRWDSVLLKSIDGINWEIIVDLKPFLNTSESISGYGLQVSDAGIIVVGTNQGRVLVSDEGQTVFNEAFKFKAGYTQNTWGYDKQGQYMLMASYGSKVADNPPREVYFSKDYGATWELIFNPPINNMLNAGDYHIHDVAFDPYSNMIIVVNGDTVNNQIHFSHDFGKTWQVVNPSGASVIHPTSILCFPEGIAFGSDDNPEGIYWWDRPSDMADPIIKNEDIRGVKLFNHEESTLGNIAVKGDTLVYGGNQYGVIGFVNHGTSAPGNPRLFATGDGGRSWHEVFKESDGNVKGFFNVHLRVENGVVIIYATYSVDSQPHVFKATMPEFY